MKATARALRDERIARAYDGSLRTTAKLFGMSHEAIRKILIAQGVEIAPACTWNSHRSPPRLRISAGSLPLPGVETVPAASPQSAAGTTISHIPACFPVSTLAGQLGGGSGRRPFLSLTR